MGLGNGIPYSSDLHSGHFMPKMKEPLHDIRVRSVSEILHTPPSIQTTINTTGTDKGIQRFPHRLLGL